MKRSGVLLLTVALAAGAGGAAAQNGPPAGARPGGPGAPQQAGLTLRGAVRDAASNQPLTAASVAVWSAADSALVTGAMTRPDGTFRIEGLRPGAYYLKVAQLGYSNGTVSRVTLAPGTPVTDVGEVKLAASAVALQGIEATAERSAVTTAVDRNVYSTRDLPAASGGNATDVLRNVPAIEVDGDGKVSLRGNENVAVQINGRPAPMRGDALTNFLKQLPANMIDRVEVVPNPSAKFDPEGMGGIINIVMKQNADLGLSGGLTLGAGTGDKYSGTGNLGYQRGALTLFGSYGLFMDQRTSSGYNRRENLGAVGAPFVNQTIEGAFDNTSHTFNGSADLRLGKETSVATSVMLSARDMSVLNSNFFTDLDAGRNVTRRYNELTRNGHDNFTADASLSFKHAFTPQKHELSAEARFNRVADNTLQRYSTLEELDAETALRRTDLDATWRDLTFQLDYTRPLSSTLKLETGYKGTLRRIDNDFAEELLSGPDLGERDNAFAYDEDIHAGYGLLTQDFGRLDLQAGLRVEAVSNTFDLTTTGEAYDNDYTSLYPSAAATLELGGQRQLRASFARRVQRPDVRMLNPFPFAEDQYNRFEGNPELRPEYTSSYELQFQQSFPWGSLQVSPFYRHTTDAFRRIRTVDPETGIATATVRNLATADNYGADVTTSLRLGRLNGFVSASGFRVVTEDEASGLGTEAFGWSARASLNYKLTPTTDVSWFQMYRAPQKVEQGRISGFSMSNVSVRQKLWGEKASLSVRLSDPFDQMGMRFRTFDAIHTQETRRKFGARAAYLTFQYNFGQAPRIRQPRPQQPDQAPQPDVPIGN